MLTFQARSLKQPAISFDDQLVGRTAILLLWRKHVATSKSGASKQEKRERLKDLRSKMGKFDDTCVKTSSATDAMTKATISGGPAAEETNKDAEHISIHSTTKVWRAFPPRLCLLKFTNRLGESTSPQCSCSSDHSGSYALPNSRKPVIWSKSRNIFTDQVTAWENPGIGEGRLVSGYLGSKVHKHHGGLGSLCVWPG